MNEKLKFGALFINLSKEFDIFDHSLLLTKLSAYGFDNNLLSFVRSCLANKIQRWKIKHHFSNWCEITIGVPQGSILAPVLFNIFINCKFLFVESSNVCSYVDDNSLFGFGNCFDEVTRNLQNDFLILDEWFFINLLALKSDKWLLQHLILYPTLNVKKSQSRAMPPEKF